jgi:hypothetical protein
MKGWRLLSWREHQEALEALEAGLWRAGQIGLVRQFPLAGNIHLLGVGRSLLSRAMPGRAAVLGTRPQ